MERCARWRHDSRSKRGWTGICERGGTNASKDIAALFTPKAEYHEWPYVTDRVGRFANLSP
jgi:hypothetical protein